jgi:hypothetical protein
MCVTVKQQQQKTGFEGYQVVPRARLEKGHLAPEVKMPNEVVCDHDGISSTPPFL